jgi:hypothetical protein
MSHSHVVGVPNIERSIIEQVPRFRCCKWSYSGTTSRVGKAEHQAKTPDVVLELARLRLEKV